MNENLMIISLSPNDKIFNFIICKVLFPRTINFKQIVNDELFYMWPIKNQVDFNFPYLTLKYLYDCSIQKDIGYLPYGTILTPFFQKAKIKPNEELQFHTPTTSTMIVVSKQHNMHLTQDDSSH